MAQEKIKITRHIKKRPNRTDSMFYYGQHIATLSLGDRTIIVESAGEMQAYFKENECYRNDMLSKELTSRGITDKKLAVLGSNDQILMNNWFRVVDEADLEEGNNKEEIAHDYDEAISVAIKLLEN